MMDRALKERIIGAGVLVLFVVLVVPVFLDGSPGGNEIVSERVLLPGQSEQANQTVVLDRDRRNPVPVASSGPTESVQTDQTASSREPQRTPPPEKQNSVERDDQTPAPVEAVASAAPASGSSTGMWAVQLGSFSNQKNAERLAADLRKQGFAAFLSQLSTTSGPLHRVRIGPQKDRQSAEAMAERLQKAGHKGQVLPHP
ncbi:MAG: SPOR domain-containing protein [Proteobacteria bacterium]|nr:SPOR domain-containing protein [Pseudomonadota bacterium]